MASYNEYAYRQEARGSDSTTVFNNWAKEMFTNSDYQPVLVRHFESGDTVTVVEFDCPWLHSPYTAFDTAAHALASWHERGMIVVRNWNDDEETNRPSWAWNLKTMSFFCGRYNQWCVIIEWENENG